MQGRKIKPIRWDSLYLLVYICFEGLPFLAYLTPSCVMLFDILPKKSVRFRARQGALLLGVFGLLQVGSGTAFAQTPPTWESDIACIVHSHCGSCHRSGGIAPFGLSTYSQVKKQGIGVSLAVQSNHMPPWPAGEGQPHLAQSTALSAQEKQMLVDWVSQGMPAGDTTLAPPAPLPSSGFSIAQPDFVLTIPTYTVPAASSDIYRCFAVSNPTAFAQTLLGLEVVPGNRQIVHHVLVFYDPTGTPLQLDAADPAPGYASFGGTGSAQSKLIGAWVPGQEAYFTPPTTGFSVQGQGCYVLQVHYPQSASGQQDSTSLRIKLSPTPQRPLFIQSPLNHQQSLTNGPLVIPANQVKTFRALYTLPAPVTLFGATPHAHLVCTSLSAWAELPNGDSVPLIHIPKWDFHWQMTYPFKQAIVLPTGTKLRGKGTYDNTFNNPRNPNFPPQTVVAGEGTSDEMMLFYFHYSPRQAGDVGWVLDTADHRTHHLNCIPLSLGQEEAEGLAWSLAPNPSSGMPALVGANPREVLVLQNAWGQRVWQGLAEERDAWNTLPTGTYWLRSLDYLRGTLPWIKMP
jgi:hypothetical protein